MAIKVRPIEPAPEPPPAPTTLPWSATRIARLALTLALALWARNLYRHWPDANNSITHAIILPIHETGHMVFMAFGEMLHAAGGSLFQILFPLIFVGYFLKRRQFYAATVPLWFAGVSAVDIVGYIKDAPIGEMELIGGEHDWSFILCETRWMHASAKIGDAVLHFGGFLMLAALLLGLYWHARPDPER